MPVSGFARLLILTPLLSFGCASPPMVRSPETALTLKPPAATSSARPASSPSRPKNVAVWAHIDQPETLLEITNLLASPGFAGEMSAYLELIDLRQPIDGVLIATGTSMSDVEPAIRVHFKDSKALFTLLSKEFQLREQGDRVIARSRSGSGSGSDDASAKDEWACEFGRGSDTAVCGSPAAVDVVADWLKTAPVPTGAAGAAAATATPNTIGRLTAYTEPLRALVGDKAGGVSSAQHEPGRRTFLEDGDQIYVDLTAGVGDRLDLHGTFHLRSSDSRVAKDLLSPPNAEKPSESFSRVWKESTGAFFIPGGGAMPRWVADLVRKSRDGTGTPTKRTRRDAAATALGDAFMKPAAIGYGVHVDRARTALAAARASSSSSSKDPNAAMQRLRDAIEPQLACALTIPIATLERAMRDFSSLAAPGSTQGMYSVRVSSAKLGLPKGSFFFEERTPDWANASQPTSPPSTAAGGKPPAPPMHVSYTLFVPATNGLGVWGAGCAVEDACVEIVKRLLSNTTMTTPENELFARPNAIVSGFVPIPSTSATHRMLLASIIQARNAAAQPSNLLLAEIERDLAAPRAAVPFVITTTPDGNGGGLIAGEMRGTRESFRSLAELGAFQGSWKIFSLLVAMFGADD